MKTINKSEELQQVIQCEDVKHAFEIIYQSELVLFPISLFRAQFPSNTRSVYGWHQDLGTWWLAENKDIADSSPYTMWLSLNGATRENSLEFAGGRYMYKLEYHRYVKGQGYFAMDNPPAEEHADQFIPDVLPGQAVIFHPLLPHRSKQGKMPLLHMRSESLARIPAKLYAHDLASLDSRNTHQKQLSFLFGGEDEGTLIQI